MLLSLRFVRFNWIDCGLLLALDCCICSFLVNLVGLNFTAIFSISSLVQLCNIDSPQSTTFSTTSTTSTAPTAPTLRIQVLNLQLTLTNVSLGISESQIQQYQQMKTSQNKGKAGSLEWIYHWAYSRINKILFISYLVMVTISWGQLTYQQSTPFTTFCAFVSSAYSNRIIFYDSSTIVYNSLQVAHIMCYSTSTQATS